ncbi:MAG: hypothetical protein AAFY84_02460 [Pseudomonadota bacterium]
MRDEPRAANNEMTMNPLLSILNSEPSETIVFFDTTNLDQDGDDFVSLSEEPFFEEETIVTDGGTVISATAAGGSVEVLTDLGFSLDGRLDSLGGGFGDFQTQFSFNDFGL